MTSPLHRSPAPAWSAVQAAEALSTAAGAAAARHALLIDDSLSLVNRTAAHFIAKDLGGHFQRRATFRPCRRPVAAPPEGLRRKILARSMLQEMRFLQSSAALRWPDGGAQRRLFLDPLYVMRSRLEASDVVLCHDVGPLTHTDLYGPSTVAWYRAA